MTLAIGSDFIINCEHPDKELDKALNLSLFNRCELPLRDSFGKNYLKINPFKNRLLRCIDIVRKHGLELILTVSAYQNKSNKNKSISIYQATRGGKEIVLSRICPNNYSYRQRTKEMLSVASKDLLKPKNDAIILSYFRYENFNQCVCENCLNIFIDFLNSKRKNFKYNNFFSLLDEKIMLDWISWKQNVINSALIEFKSAFNSSIIVELDFDQTKCYLSGPMVEEGLNFVSIIPIVSELYLHIEPCVPVANFSSSQRANQRVYLNLLKYLNFLGQSVNTRINFFFWFLSNSKQINANLKPYLELTDLVSPYGIVLLTNNPVLLSKALNEQLLALEF